MKINDQVKITMKERSSAWLETWRLEMWLRPEFESKLYMERQLPLTPVLGDSILYSGFEATTPVCIIKNKNESKKKLE